MNELGLEPNLKEMFYYEKGYHWNYDMKDYVIWLEKNLTISLITLGKLDKVLDIL